MEKTTTLNIRINPDVKRRAEEVLSQLGIPMSTAIDIYLKQISITGGIPFAVTLPKAPVSVNADLMTTDEIHAKLKEGYSDIEKGNVQDASAAFQRFRETNA
ncbi:type II toxin-antitoxin system RelB/DinJ family antitoxin [Desulfosporosinus lacus]|uniref:Addiction module antitoxin, RelB/DinJ family n=1 Tax=Desulfosporosinus lacus DSM 15449 TaxID=1121420 RepID=A0A1M5V9U6_9FIRM|nr:type II toxin-antitoxin system RelB/DinJ family antitoxin [Desulfosporosinus lacus]SHH71683.1 addiction module antitoxin, RelB/DinJ family [Desulfosporosinus lacus DSM 15449]